MPAVTCRSDSPNLIRNKMDRRSVGRKKKDEKHSKRKLFYLSTRCIKRFLYELGNSKFIS